MYRPDEKFCRRNIRLCCYCRVPARKTIKSGYGKEVSGLLSKEILARAEADLEKLPVTVTSFIAERSVGGLHDFYSEGDYWWPGHAAPRSSVHPAGRRNES